MVATNVEIAGIIRSLVKCLEPHVRIKMLFLFGSYATDRPKDWSDIDVAVVSPDFAGVPLWRRQQLLAHYLRDADVRLSPIGYSPEELESPPLFLREIIRTGKVVYHSPEAEAPS